ncbi:MAG: pyridoxal kinase [Hyphomicrobiaceae bacterium]
MARILAISSQVARGHVGLSAIVPALQALGHDVIALPTIMLSNHPGHPHVAGERVAPELLRRMLDALATNGWLGEVDAVLTGYLPSVEHVLFAREAVERVRERKPQSPILVDPVLGDHPKGLYIARDAAETIRDNLLPHASIIKLNVFEAEWLTGRSIATERDAIGAARALSSVAVVMTSVPGPDAMLSNMLVAGEAGLCQSVRVQHLQRAPHGTGDLLSALLLGHLMNHDMTLSLALSRAIAGLDAVVRASRNNEELLLIDHLASLASCTPLPLADVSNA